MTNWKQIDTYAKKWIEEAGEKLRCSFEKKLNIETKTNPNDLVTNMDRETEQFFLDKITETFPGHRVLGEEGMGDAVSDLKGIVWIIDPIDGTMNFIHQQRNFAISIGILEDGIGKIGLVYDVVHDELYHAFKGQGAYMNDKEIPKLKEVAVKEAILSLNATWVTENKKLDPSILAPLVRDVRGTRSYGSAALELAFVAAGRLDAYITPRLSPWDFAGGAILIEEAGGEVSDLYGNPLDYIKGGSLFVSKPGLHKEIRENYLKNL
ncbi:inositol monophosphatase family protein [Peribacillus glennii]|uniref:inositol-phosphate phosphatase n=1 Tax=Peribacillus glennii TaxID=2303991 RepID=A0A372LBZ0_9BACI|nr:inositol monophosphatase family protein [Peribacillus glennii]RFU63414.1 inositol monophosphatase family protein [Peribacillus glennii]